MASRRRTLHDTSLDERLSEYLTRLPELSLRSRPSVFWERQLEDLRATSSLPEGAPPSPGDLEAIVRSLGYGFEDLDGDTASARSDERFVAASEGAERIGRLAKGFGPRGLEVTPGEWEHAAALRFLDRHEATDEYVTLLDELAVRSSMSAARHFWYLRMVRGLVDAHGPARPLDVIEIGAGAGNLAVLLHTVALVRSYVIVDLPELLVHSAYTLSKYVPEIDLRFEPAAAASAGPVATLLTPEQAALLPDHSADLALNFNSFMEMDQAARDAYLELVYRVGRPGSLFVNVNRRQRALPSRDGSSFDNNPLLYPYRADDEVLVWEEDEFQTVTRMRPGRLSSLAIVRAALLAG